MLSERLCSNLSLVEHYLEYGVGARLCTQRGQIQAKIARYDPEIVWTGFDNSQRRVERIELTCHQKRLRRSE
jgi:hypothetical protein